MPGGSGLFGPTPFRWRGRLRGGWRPWWLVARELGDGLEGEGLQGVAGEDGDGFAEDLVAGGLAAAEVVVVEGG